MHRVLLSAVFVSVLASASHAQDATQSFGKIERGHYLTQAGDCVACHTAPGGKPFAGGLRLETPFGIIVTPNITPDRETGIGAMTDDEFVRVMHEGIGKGGKRLYPAMPFPSYTKVSREDILAIRAYLKTIEPVKHKVVSNQLPFPFDIRQGMIAWKMINFQPGLFKPDPGKSDEWNRGAYLVQGLGHCGTCHTPKNFMGGEKTSSPLAGSPVQNWFAPNITADKHKGIGGWDIAEIMQYLKTGATPRTLASGPMADEIRHASSNMTDSDLKAIAVYLKSAGTDRQAERPSPIPATDRQVAMGQAIYKKNCSACHTESGDGASHIFPKLSGSALVQSDDPTTLIRIVLQGSRAVGTKAAPTSPAMPRFGWRLSNDEVAAVLTYIRNAWGNAGAAVNASDVDKMRHKLSSSN